MHKHRDSRFVERVFTEYEQSLIRAATGREDYMLWRLWAAKESAFKIVRKLDPVASFAHRLFDLREDGRLHHGDRSFVPRWMDHPEYIHCVACAQDDALADVFIANVAQVAGLPRELDEEEMASVHSQESLLVRIFAKSQLRARFPDSRLKIIRPRREDGQFAPPVLLLNEQWSGIDLSLAHDGPWLAVAASPGSPALT